MSPFPSRLPSAAAFAATLLARSASLLAQEPPGAPATLPVPAPEPTSLSAVPQIDRAAAETLFGLGQKLIDEGKAAEACPRFAESMRLDPAPGTLMNLARCHELVGKTASAWAEYRQAAILLQQSGNAERATAAAGYALALEPALARLALVAPAVVPGLEVVRDGVVYGVASLDVPLVVDPGSHRLEVRAPGFESQTIEVDVTGGRTSTATLPALKPLATAEPPSPQPPAAPAVSTSSNPLRVAGLVTAGVGVVAVGAGAILGGLAASEVADAETDNTLCGADRTCTPAGLAQIDGADDKATAATALMAVGGGAVLGGLVLLLAGELNGGEDSTPPTWQASATVDPSGGGLVWKGRF